MIAAAVICAAAVIAQMLAELGSWRAVRASAKIVASAAFCVAGGLAAWRAPSPLATWIVIGLCWGAVGDVALLRRDTLSFLAGLTAFLIGHLAYVVAIAGVLPPLTAGWAIAGVPAIAGAIALRWLSPHVRGVMRYAVAAYVIVIVAMVGLALIAAGNPALSPPLRTRLAIAAVAFFASDLAVARDRFVAPGVVNKLWGLPVYYAAQLVFAFAVAAS